MKYFSLEMSTECTICLETYQGNIRITDCGHRTSSYLISDGKLIQWWTEGCHTRPRRILRFFSFVKNLSFITVLWNSDNRIIFCEFEWTPESYCEKCLKLYIKNQMNWLCPICRTKHRKTYDELPRNFFAENLIAESSSSVSFQFRHMSISKKTYDNCKRQVTYLIEQWFILKRAKKRLTFRLKS